MAHPSVDADAYKPICGDIHNPADTYLPEITTPNPTTPRDSDFRLVAEGPFWRVVADQSELSGCVMRFAVLGTLTVEGPDGPVELGAPKQRAVLALLLLSANRVVSVDRIIDHLWSGEPPPGALGTVHAYVSVLRRILEPGRVPVRSRACSSAWRLGTCCASSLRISDVLRFEEMVATVWPMIDDDPLAAIAQLDAALALWRGPLLAEFAHETWVRDVAVRLDERRVSGSKPDFSCLSRLAALRTSSPISKQPCRCIPSVRGCGRC